MRSRADLMHLDFIIRGWNMLRYHSCYLLREMEDSRRIQLSRGCLPSFLMFGGFVFHLPLISPFVIRITSSLSLRLCLKCCVFMQNPCLAYLSRLKWRLKCSSVACLTSMIPPPPPPPPSLSPSLSLCWESFFFLSHASLMPRKSQS